MVFPLVLVTTIAMVGWPGDGPSLIVRGADLSRGVLVNLSPGARPFDLPDPGRPTVVFVHGANPMPRVVHFTMAEQFAAALARRGLGFNILAWDWNAAAATGIRPSTHYAVAVQQGWCLAGALWSAGLDPARLHLIGHSSGGMVVAAAARAFASGCGRPVAQLTFLEPAAGYHSVIFEDLAAWSTACRVENDWAPGPSGFGRAVAYPGVVNLGVPGPTPLLGMFDLLESSHLAIVRWYIATAADPTSPVGFNTSLLLRPGA